MLEEFEAERKRTGITDENVCPVRCCGFPLLLDKRNLVRHFAISHKKVNTAFRHLCKKQNWEYETLKLHNFFVEPNMSDNQVERCRNCKSSVRKTMLTVHWDYCYTRGRFANKLANILLGRSKLAELDVEFQSYQCPYCDIRSTFGSLFEHCMKLHSVDFKRYSAEAMETGTLAADDDVIELDTDTSDVEVVVAGTSAVDSPTGIEILNWFSRG